MKPQKKVIPKLKLILIWVVSSFILLEAALRLLGYQPLQIPHGFIQSSPEQFLAPDSILGFSLVPGSYDITINDHLSYNANHNQYYERLTYDGKQSNLKKIYSYGCSFTYGMGIDDNESYPYLIDKSLSNYKVHNKAVPGYGTIQSYLSLQKSIRENSSPDVIILSYYAFHDKRNVLSRIYRKKIHIGMLSNNKEHLTNRRKDELNSWRFPFYDTNNKAIDYIKTFNIYHNFPFREKSAALNLMEIRYNEFMENEQEAKKASYEILKKITKLCQENNIKFYLANMDQKSKNLEDFCSDNNIEFIDSFVDLNQESYRNTPYDQHPSPIAHHEYATLILNHLEKDSIY